MHIFKVENDALLMKLLFSSVPVSENGSLYAYLVDTLHDDHADYMEVLSCHHVVSGRIDAWVERLKHTTEGIR